MHLLAQAAVADLSIADLLKVGGSISASAVLIVLAVWTAKYGFPKLMATFEKVAADQNATAEKLQTAFLNENRAIRAEHREDLKTITASHAGAYDKLADTLAELKEAIHK